MTSAQHPQKGNFTFGYTKSSLERYASRTAETCCGYLLPYLESLKPDFTFLDIGCGPGSITTDLASRFPKAKFTGVDPGKLFIDKAQDLAQERGVIGNTEFKAGEIDGLQDVLGEQFGTFDVVHCHQVLNHVQDPVAALKVMKTAAKSDGGIVASREATTSNGNIFYPEPPEIEQWRHVQAEIFRSNTGRYGLGSRLVGYALQAGFPRSLIKAGSGVDCYSEPAEKAVWAGSMVSALENKESDWYKKALAGGESGKSLAKMAEAWREWGRRDESWSVFVSAEVVCKNA